MTDSKESTILTLVKGSNWRLSVLQSRKSGVCDVVSTMSDHPYRNEMVRLLLHSFYAIRVSFFISVSTREATLNERLRSIKRKESRAERRSMKRKAVLKEEV